MTYGAERIRQCTLVAMYGDKPAEFEAWVKRCQDMLEGLLAERFLPTRMHAVHATIVGFERAQADNLINLNYLRLRKEQREMNVRGYLDWVAVSPLLPFSVRIGGFAPDEQPFLDRNLPPYHRSFGIYGDKVVVVGWPAARHGQEERYTTNLDALRRKAGDFNILHGYHAHDDSFDNAFYFRIGATRDLNDQEASAVEETLRGLIQDMGPCYVKLESQGLKIVSYLAQTLPAGSTRACAMEDLDAVKLREFYDLPVEG